MDRMDETEARLILAAYPEAPDFEILRKWSWKRKRGAGTVYDAAKKFKVPARVISAVVNAFGPYGYFYIIRNGPSSKEMNFVHEGE